MARNKKSGDKQRYVKALGLIALEQRLFKEAEQGNSVKHGTKYKGSCITHQEVNASCAPGNKCYENAERSQKE